MKILHSVAIAIALMATPVVTSTASAEVMQRVAARDIIGTYRVNGVGITRKKYRGRAFITGGPNGVQVTWRIGGNEIVGYGAVIGNVLVVDWGTEDRMMYVVGIDGDLHGTHSTKLSAERLTRIR